MIWIPTYFIELHICFRKMQVKLVQSIGVINSIFVSYFLIECVAELRNYIQMLVIFSIGTRPRCRYPSGYVIINNNGTELQFS